MNNNMIVALFLLAVACAVMGGIMAWMLGMLDTYLDRREHNEWGNG